MAERGVDATHNRKKAFVNDPTLRDEDFRLFVEAMPQMAWIASADGSVTWYNRRWYEYTGASPDSSKGWGWRELHEPAALPRVMAAWEKSLRSGEPFEMVFPLRSKEGQFRRFLTRVSPIRSESGDVLRWFGTGTDVEEQQRNEDRVSLANAIVNSTSDAIITKNLDGVITSWNPAAERIFGYRPDEVIGKSVTILFPPELVKDEAEILQRIRRGELIDHFQTVRVRKDGTRLDISLTISPVRDREGRIVGASKIARDITEQKRAARAAQHMAAVVESSADAIITKTLDGIITSWNPSAQRIFGYTPDEVIGKPITILFPENHVNEEPEIIARIKRGERMEHYETERRRKDGTIIPISLTVSPIRDETGRIVGASKIVRDISSQKAYENHLIHQANELEQFAYVASHDLREPLRKVAVYSELLLSRFSPTAGSDAAKYVGYISSAVVRMQKLIGDLLSYSRADRADVNPENVDLAGVVRTVLADLEFPIKESGARVDVGPLPVVRANPFQMHQLFQNLISNAIKFRGERAPTVTVRSERRERDIVIAVSDNGIGIEPQYRDRIFRIFQRLHSVEQYPGTGIGLAICKKIVERHGGRIWVDSTPGRGTTFSFTLPAAPAAGGAEITK